MRYKCTVSYDGAAYDGWQSQKLGLSIQEKIEAVLLRITRKKTNVIASGRTDAGVNARAQVFMFDTELVMKPRKWMGALNGFLPKDIHIQKVEEADDRLFHARYNVRWKKYAYRINTGPYDVFTKDYVYQCPVQLDFEAMKEASKQLIGTHDFTTFNSSPLSEYPDQVRTIFDISLEKKNDVITITYRGKGFLRFMVRMMSEALMEVGRHKVPVSHIHDMLEARSKSFPHRNSPACGLTLEEVNYFEILALNEYGMVREYLFDDDLPAGKTIEELEERVREHSPDRWFVFTERHSQKNLGRFEVHGNKASFLLCEEGEREHAARLLADLERWCEKNGVSGEITFGVIS
jgi:tRNA pseudouridine38-40 synthase